MVEMSFDRSRIAYAALLGSILAAGIPGCAAANHTQAGAALGTGFGALAGAMIGSDSGHAGEGALIGAATGALVGGAIGNAEDQAEREIAAVAHAQHVQQAQQALTNADLVRLTQNGISDDVILSSVAARGGRFDLSPEAIISLKNQGVSDKVIIGVQDTAAKQNSVPVAVDPVLGPPPPVVVVPAGVSMGVVVGPRRHHHPRFYIGHHFGPHCW